jgi:hypothetical protein
MSDRIVESLNEMKQIYLESVSGNVISNRDEYLEYVEEKYKTSKKEDEDKKESEKEEKDDDEKDEDEDKEGEEDEKPKRWWDDDGDGVGYEKDEVKSSFKKKTKKVDESLSNWRSDLYEAIGNIDDEIEGSKQRQVKEKANIHNKIDINPNVNIGESVELSEEYIGEVIDIAAQYFYDRGLNEEGLAMVIEDLGHEKFIEYVFYISEDFMLSEARTLLGKKSNPATGKDRGISLKAAPGKTTRAAAEKYGTTRRFSSSRPTGTVRKKIVKDQGDNSAKTAAETQPKGIDKVVSQVKNFATSPDTKARLTNMIGAAVNKAKSDIGRTGMAAVHATDAAKKARQRGASGAGAAGAAAGTFIRGLMRGSTATGVREEIEAFLLEKSESQQQQKLFGLALSVKRGETPRSEVSQEVLDIVDKMSEAEIRKFAKTSHEGLPKKVEEKD